MTSLRLRSLSILAVGVVLPLAGFALESDLPGLFFMACPGVGAVVLMAGVGLQRRTPA